MMCMVGAKEIVLCIKVDNLNALIWHIDTAYPIHHIMKGHTGASMYMGVGTLHSDSSMQKINVKNCTESEPVEVNDCMPQVLWKTYFIGVQ